MTVTETLVDWAWDLDLDAVPVPVRAAAQRHLLDGLGTAVAAARLEAAPFVAAMVDGFTEPREATVVVDGRRVPAPAAAFANGALVHALDFDDTHAGGLVHATAVVMPVALAVGEHFDRSGADALAAVVAGLETVTRLAAGVPHGFHGRGFHATSVCGVFAAALVAARLAGLPRRQAVDALGVAGSQSSGLLEFLHTRASTKQLHPGWAAMSGILAARLAAAGATGPESVVEGDFGLYAAYAGARPDPAVVTGGLGDRWETVEMTIKPDPVCQLAHASLDALRRVLPEVPAAGAVARICFEVPSESVPIVCEPAGRKRRPESTYEAKFSLPWSAAALVVDGELDVGSFAPDRLARQEVLEVADRVGYRPSDPGIPAADAPGRVEVELGDGRRLVHEVRRSRGGPTAPLSDDDVVAKFTANCGGASPAATELARRVLALENEPTVRGLLEPTTLVGDTPQEER